MSVLLVFALVFSPVITAAEPRIPGFYGQMNLPEPVANALPQVRQAVRGVDRIERAGNKLTVHQKEKNAVLDWESFNIGKDAWVHFDQNQTNWAALNRIYDQNPTQIFGKLTAGGKVFLMNPNGILFSKGSRVNVNTLVASSLRMKEEDFLKGAWKFKQAAGDPGETCVSNHGDITTGEGGQVFLVGPRAENFGRIQTPAGQQGLVAGTDVEIYELPPEEMQDQDRTARVIRVAEGAGTAENGSGGVMEADGGVAGMYGNIVNQNGIIRSVRAVSRGGRIELLAAEKIRTGDDSITECLNSDADETYHESFTLQKGEVVLDGLDPANPLFPTDHVNVIEHRGTITAPGGDVKMTADTRVFLETGSRIDVAGEAVTTTATGRLAKVQLNSVELRDDYGQKDGSLKGETITVNPVDGSAIGNVSAHLAAENKTVRQMATAGGNVTILVPTGDIVVKKGAEIDFSGGVTTYTAGHGDITRLKCGNSSYSISDAPQWLTYDGILNRREVRYERYGIVETHDGLNFGGANSLIQYVPSYTEGARAGVLALTAPRIALEGRLNGSVTLGAYQTRLSELTNSQGVVNARGWVEPEAGKLYIGGTKTSDDAVNLNMILENALLTTKDLNLPGSFGVSDALPDITFNNGEMINPSIISPDILADSGAGQIHINLNRRFVTEDSTSLALPSRTWFSVNAAQITHRGDIDIPSGKINMTLRANVTTSPTKPQYEPIEGRLFLAPGSRLNVSGAKLGRPEPGETDETYHHAHQFGGDIQLLDHMEDSGYGVILAPGATVDVSGGYRVGPDGGISGGDAGKLAITGHHIVLNGTIDGSALEGYDGGAISLHAENLRVTTPGGRAAAKRRMEGGDGGYLVLTDDQLADTGFTRIELLSANDLIVENGVSLAPSGRRLAAPALMASADDTAPVNFENPAAGDPASGQPVLTPERMGKSAIKLTTGRELMGDEANTDTRIVLSPLAEIDVFPTGEISLNSARVEIGGSLNAPAGKIAVTADRGDLVLYPNARLSARGVAYVDGENGGPNGLGIPTCLDGGTITLSALGTLDLNAGSVLDVSGSDRVFNHENSGTNQLVRKETASHAGRIELISDNGFEIDAELKGAAALAGLKGGGFRLASHNMDRALVADADFLYTLAESGFDDVALESWRGVTLETPLDISFDRKFTIDAPEIATTGQGRVRLDAPWVALQNTYSPQAGAVNAGDASLEVTADWIDLTGRVQFNGAGSVALNARKDIRLSHYYYQTTGSAKWDGGMAVPGDLVMRASHVYPANNDPETPTDFTIQANGKVVILPAHNPVDHPIVSAGGRLSIEAETIEHYGVLAAPMGEIHLKATGTGGQVLVAGNAVIDTHGRVPVYYGKLKETYWSTKDRATLQQTEVTGAPASGITIEGDAVAIEPGATLDFSGGGSIFTYEWLPGIEGSHNPLEKDGRFVIWPEHANTLPGEAVYLEGGGGIDAGVYTLLPASYAFLPGAVVIESAGYSEVPGGSLMSGAGDPVVAGYQTFSGQDGRSPVKAHFIVRQASEVRKEGFYNYRTMVAGDAGYAEVAAKTATLGGDLLGHALLDKYRGGAISLSSTEIQVGNTAPATGAEGVLFLRADSLAGKGIQRITLGDASITERILVAGDTQWELPELRMNAGETVVVREGAGLTGSGADSFIGIAVPDGAFQVEENATISGFKNIDMAIGSLDLAGDLALDNTHLAISTRDLFLVPDGYTGEGSGGLYLDGSFQEKMSKTERLALTAENGMTLKDNARIESGERVDITTPLWVSTGKTNRSVTVKAGAVTLRGGAAQSGGNAVAGGDLSVTGNTVTVGSGEIRLDGFGETRIDAEKDILFSGEGGLATGGHLTLVSRRIGTTPHRPSEEDFIRTDFRIASDGHLAILGKPGGAESTAANTGRLRFEARRIDHKGIIDVRSGTVSLTATGTAEDSGIFLSAGSKILNRGGAGGPGGDVALNALNGGIHLTAAGVVDVSAGETGDAGRVWFLSPNGETRLDGDILAHATQGDGGSLHVHAAGFGLDLDHWSGKIAAGGFDRDLYLRDSRGDMRLGADQALSAGNIRLVSDSGKIDILGTLESRDGRPGTVELYAAGDVTLAAGAVVRVEDPGNNQGVGTVRIGSAEGHVDILKDAEIRFTTLAGESRGQVYLRAGRTGDGANVRIRMAGDVIGASLVGFEAFKTYDAQVVNAELLTTLHQENQTFMAGAGGIMAGITAGSTMEGATAMLLPGLEIRNEGDITVSDALNLSDLRYGDENTPGALAIRAGGSLGVNGDVYDYVGEGALNDIAGDSWRIDLCAGADLAGADPLATRNNAGDLVIGEGRFVFTQSGALRFASGGDTVVNGGGGLTGATNRIKYSLATHDGQVSGRVNGSLVVRGGAIQSNTGDIDISVGGDLRLEIPGTTAGAIRTLGLAPEGKEKEYWNYAGGGNIHLAVTGEVAGAMNEDAWDQAYTYRGVDAQGNPIMKYAWGANYNEPPTQGIAAMAGGDVTLFSGGNTSAQVGAFGQGTLTVAALGDLDGRFLARDGHTRLFSGGNFGARSDSTTVELLAASVDIHAEGKLVLGSVVNPTIIRKGLYGAGKWNLTYSLDSRVSLETKYGDVIMTGKSVHDLDPTQKALASILPPGLSIESGRNVWLKNRFTLAPSGQGNLEISAAGTIEGEYITGTSTGLLVNRALIRMPDIAPERVFGDHSGEKKTVGEGFFDFLAFLESKTAHAAVPIHRDNDTPVRISAGENLQNIEFFLPKQARISAGNDITDIFYHGQNVSETDLTSVIAGGRITFSNRPTTFANSGFEHGGPGQFILQAGGTIDLGLSDGVRSIGNIYNLALPMSGSDLTVVAGAGEGFSLDNCEEFFQGLREKGKLYSEKLAEGELEEAEKYVEEARKEYIKAVADNLDRDNGDLNMINSTIHTLGEKDPVYILAGGDVNVGRSTLSGDSGGNTGIYTASGGGIGLFSKGDLNVNESRVMTFRGGDVTFWTDKGNINAGRGAKTAISADPPQLVFENDQWVLRFKPPAAGSGIRTLTYDPDGTGPLPTPEAGDLYLFAPEGEIDAGEAGISGRNVILGATKVVNAQNIDFSMGSVGVPEVGGATASLGALAGAGTVSEASKMAEDSAMLGNQDERFSKYVKDISETLVPKWLAVEVLGFEEDEGDSEASETSEE